MGIDSDTELPLYQIYMDEPSGYANPYMRMRKTGYWDDGNEGFFLGFDAGATGPTGPTGVTGDVKFNLGGETNYLKWNGNALDIKGDIGGTIGQISIEGPVSNSGITITEDGIKGSDGSIDTFNLNKNGDLTIIGTVTADAGAIGG